MIHLIGYSGLALNLISMTMKNMFYLRLFALLANGIYVVYGAIINAPPFIIGCSIAVIIHVYQIVKISKTKKTEALTHFIDSI